MPEAAMTTGRTARAEHLDARQVARRIFECEWKIVEVMCGTDHVSLLCRRQDVVASLTDRELEIVYHTSRGRSDKWSAIELGVSRTTVASHLSNAMAKLGMTRTELALLGFLFEDEDASPLEVTSMRIGGSEFVALTFPRSDLIDATQLTDAECEVLKWTVEGCSNREIAMRRGVSSRTVANQLRSIYRKFGVNSRAELATLLARSACFLIGALTKF